MRKIKIKNSLMSSLFPLIFVVIICLFFSLSVLGQSKVLIKVSQETIVESDRIELGKIAKILGDSTKTERLKSISLGYTPNIGMTREIFRSQIILAISAAGFTENEVSLETPAKILVHRIGQQISANQMREAVEKAVLSQFSTDKVSVQIVRLDLPENFQVPTGKTEIRITTPNVSNPFRPFSLPIEIRIDDKTVRRFAVNLEIAAFTEILVAARELTANSKIVESDVRFEKHRLEKPIATYLRETNRLRGMVLLKNISDGMPITTDLITAGYVIKSGDLVQIEAQSGTFKITIKGEARTSGKIGDRISVKNSQSGAILQAIVIDQGLVKINF